MKNHTLLKVLAAIILAVIAGWLTGPDSQLLGIPYVKIYSLIGQLFFNALMLVVVPLVTSSIITGTARMGSEQSFGILGAKTFGYYILTNSLAILVGVLAFLLINPGSSVENIAGFMSSGAEGQAANIVAQSQGDAFDKVSQILIKLIPSNIFAAASQGQMLGLIFFSILFGYFLSKIESHPASILTAFWKGIFQIMMHITHFVMKALPIGVFGLVAKVVATTGLDAFGSIAYFSLTILVSLAVYALVVLPGMLAGIAKVNPLLHFQAMAPALLTAFSTSSSAATLPATIECIEKRAGVSNRICSFAIPLGTSLNLSGTALYQCVASLFITQVYGIDLTASTVIFIAFMALLTSIGMAGIPSSSLISVVVILQTLGVPIEGIALIMPVERILDMIRTVVNVFGNTCCAVLIAKSEGEKDVLATNSLLSTKAAG